MLHCISCCDLQNPIDILKCVSETSLIFFKLQIPVLAVEIAMDHKPSHREMTSVLISDLYGRIVTQKDIARGWLLFHTSGYRWRHQEDNCVS